MQDNDFEELKKRIEDNYITLSDPEFWEESWPIMIDPDGKAVDILLANGEEGDKILCGYALDSSAYHMLCGHH